jgi:hypothetical protein
VFKDLQPDQMGRLPTLNQMLKMAAKKKPVEKHVAEFQNGRLAFICARLQR